MACPPEPELFAHAGRRRAAGSAPLAERLRPTQIDQFVDSGGLLAPGGWLAGALAAGRLPSLLLWGPPGCGKTTLARLLARQAGHELIALSATTTGVAGLRESVGQAETRLGATGRATTLFVDEIHRLDRRQQDALLHAVEEGRVTLLGATTENPGFHVTAALRSRCRLLALPALNEPGALALAQRALGDVDRGLGAHKLALDESGGQALVRLSAGDGRRLLNLLEQAALVTRSRNASVISLADLQAAAGRNLPAHDRHGDQHFDLLSALHKSLRGSDPDAAAYYVQRMLVAGEDPRVVARRMVRMASEDVGLADPRALSVALDALRAVEFLGLPEGDAALVQAAIYLALAPKSDAVYRASKSARDAVESHGALPVPLHLRNAPTAVHRQQGAGGYENPHTAPERVTGAEHLPATLAGQSFYEPSDRGAEVELARRLAEVRRRRERSRSGSTPTPPADPPARGG